MSAEEEWIRIVTIALTGCAGVLGDKWGFTNPSPARDEEVGDTVLAAFAVADVYMAELKQRRAKEWEKMMGRELEPTGDAQ